MDLPDHSRSTHLADSATTRADRTLDRHKFSARRHRLWWRPLILAVTAILVAVVGIGAISGAMRTPTPGDLSLGREALTDLSPFERQTLADKYVTEAELDESIAHFTDCLTSAGIDYEIEPGPVSLSRVAMYGGPAHGWSAADQGAYDAAMDRCVDEVSAVENVWILQGNGAPGVTPLPGLREALASLNTSGW